APKVKKYKTSKLIRMQHFADALRDDVYNPLIGITVGVLKNIMEILRPDKTLCPQRLRDAIDSGRWEGKTLWEAFGVGNKWEGKAERLQELLHRIYSEREILFELQARPIHLLLGELALIEPDRFIYRRTAKERRWIILSKECVISDSTLALRPDANVANTG